MDPLYSKAQQKIGGSTSKATSKGSARKTRKKKKGSKSKTQNAGQPSGPGGSVSTAERSRSRSAVVPEEAQTASSVDSSEPGCGSKISSYTVGAVHALDMGTGLALLVYGGMVHVVSVTAAAVCYGLVMLLGAIAGAIGYYSDVFNRRGLLGSAISGVILCLLDICLFFAVFAGWSSFINFLKENQEALMLNEGSIDTIDGLRFVYAIIFIIFAGLEGHRAMLMWGLKDTMQGSSRSSSSSNGCCDGLLSMLGLSKRKRTDDFVVFDDNASLESSLLWSKDAAQPASDDYLEFVPEHERGLATFTSNVDMPRPPEDRTDY